MRNDRSDALGAGMDMVDGCLVVPVDGDADPDLLLGLMEAILTKVRKKRPRAVIINIASIRIMDSYTFMILKKMASAITILGALPVIVGVQAGVASSLVDLDMDFGKILTVVTTEDALEIVRSRSI